MQDVEGLRRYYHFCVVSTIAFTQTAACSVFLEWPMHSHNHGVYRSKPSAKGPVLRQKKKITFLTSILKAPLLWEEEASEVNTDLIAGLSIANRSSAPELSGDACYLKQRAL